MCQPRPPCPQGKHGIECLKECQRNCKTCDSETECITCKYGYYGSRCLNRCNETCQSGNCSMDGLCTGGTDTCTVRCRHCWKYEHQNECKACKAGYYGENCEHTCTNCKLGTHCSRLNGTCDMCKDAFSGTECDKPCYSQCETCMRDVEYQCETCQPAQYGRRCDSICPGNCLNNRCNISTGECDGGCHMSLHHGVNCTELCPENCLHTTCYKDGNCDKGCKLGFCGHTCSQVCPGNDLNCLSFERHNTTEGLMCSHCRTGYCINASGLCEKMGDREGHSLHGRECDSELKHRPSHERDMPTNISFNCSQYCSAGPSNITPICETHVGLCLRVCSKGYHGDRCNQTCDIWCDNGTCYNVNGSKTAECINGNLLFACFVGASCI